MFPYLTTGLKKVWAAITALQSSLANVQSSAVRFLDYSNTLEKIEYSANTEQTFNAIGGIYIIDINFNMGGYIKINNVVVFNFTTATNERIELPFKGGEVIAFRGSNGGSVSVMAIPFAAN